MFFYNWADVVSFFQTEQVVFEKKKVSILRIPKKVFNRNPVLKLRSVRLNLVVNNDDVLQVAPFWE